MLLYEGIDDFDVQIEGGTVQVFLHEGSYTVPATRLSDGTLRYLCLLAFFVILALDRWSVSEEPKARFASRCTAYTRSTP